MDDTHTMSFNLDWKQKTPAAQTLTRTATADPRPIARRRRPAEHQRLVRPLAPGGQRENDYLIDREHQKNVSYTGIQGLPRRIRR